MRVKLIELLHAFFASHTRRVTAAEFLKMDTDAVKLQMISAIRTINPFQRWALMLYDEL